MCEAIEVVTVRIGRPLLIGYDYKCREYLVMDLH
jgi:hypothetical protein